jgi:tRNA G37 N-methylase Trm5
MRGWEIFYVPDTRWYEEVFKLVQEGSTVLDAGAGDLRFSLALAKKCKMVYAVEINPRVLGPALATIGYRLPKNVVPSCQNVFNMPVPVDVEEIVCIMIHRQHEFPIWWNNHTVIHAEHSGVHRTQVGN